MSPGDFLTTNNLKTPLIINVSGILFSVTFLTSFFFSYCLVNSLNYVCYIKVKGFSIRLLLSRVCVCGGGRGFLRIKSLRSSVLFLLLLKDSSFIRNIICCKERKCLDVESRVMERVNPLQPIARGLGFTLKDRHSSPEMTCYTMEQWHNCEGEAGCHPTAITCRPFADLVGAFSRCRQGWRQVGARGPSGRAGIPVMECLHFRRGVCSRKYAVPEDV